MRSSIMRTTHRDYRDLAVRHLPKMVAGYFIVAIFVAVVSLPVSLISEIEFPADSGLRTTLGYTLSVMLGSAFIYIVGVPSSLIALTSTLDNWSWFIRDVPQLIWRNKHRIAIGLLKSVAIPLFLVAAYWFMAQRIPVGLPPLGIWVINAIIATRFVMLDSYRVFRDDMTIIDTFGMLMPKKMQKNNPARKKNRLSSVPFSTFGDGALAFPMLQAFLVSLMTIFAVSSIFGEVANNSSWAVAYTASFSTMIYLWMIAMRLVDALKPWGEKGKLSILNHGDGTRIQSRRSQREKSSNRV